MGSSNGLDEGKFSYSGGDSMPSTAVITSSHDSVAATVTVGGTFAVGNGEETFGTYTSYFIADSRDPGTIVATVSHPSPPAAPAALRPRVVSRGPCALRRFSHAPRAARRSRCTPPAPGAASRSTTCSGRSRSLPCRRSTFRPTLQQSATTRAPTTGVTATPSTGASPLRSPRPTPRPRHLASPSSRR